VAVGNDVTKGVTVTNTGTTALDISRVGVTGTDAGDFTPTNHCPSSLAPTDSCTIEVKFAPSATGSRTADLTVIDNAKTSPQRAPLLGKGSN
jgi:archaellum component FlaF (FlaF/FlaG flagellin family)